MFATIYGPFASRVRATSCESFAYAICFGTSVFGLFFNVFCCINSYFVILDFHCLLITLLCCNIVLMYREWMFVVNYLASACLELAACLRCRQSCLLFQLGFGDQVIFNTNYISVRCPSILFVQKTYVLYQLLVFIALHFNSFFRRLIECEIDTFTSELLS